MKNRKNRHKLLAISFLIFSFSCTQSIKIKLTNPPQLPVKENIKKIGIFNRTLPKEQDHPNTKIDELLSLEGLQLDAKGSQASIQRLNNLFSNKSRFSSSKIINHVNDTTLYVFAPKPDQISWDKVNTICKANDIDALAVLEYYDTESNFTQRSAPVTTDVPIVGGQVTTNKFYVTVNTKVNAFWRIYDNKNRTDSYKITYNETVITKSEGISILAAYNAVNGREQKVIQKSQKIADDISRKMEPHTYWVNRDYYHKGSSNFKAAQKRVVTNSWKEANSYWKTDTNHPKDKIKGRAYFNLALGAEVAGDIDKAIEYATESYHVSGNKKAVDYLKTLKHMKKSGIERAK